MLGMIDMAGLQAKDSPAPARADAGNKASFMLLHGRLATDCSFSICDGKVDGFPLRYASQGFVDLFGYSVSECMGKQCGSLVGAPAILASDQALRSVMEASGIDAGGAQERLGFLTEFVGEQMRRMAADPEAHVGQALLVNRKKNGDLFVCELTTQMRKHPTLGWPYVIGVQRDVSEDLPVSALLEAVGTGAYASLIDRHSGTKAHTVAQLNAADTVAYMHHKAFDMWQAQMWDLVGPPTTSALDKANREDGGRSKGSKRSGKSCKSASSMGSVASTRSAGSTASRSSASSYASSASSSWSSGSRSGLAAADPHHGQVFSAGLLHRQMVPANTTKDRFFDLLDDYSDDGAFEQDLGGLDDVAEEDEMDDDGSTPMARRQESAPAVLCSAGTCSPSPLADVDESSALDRYYDLLDSPLLIHAPEEARRNPNALSGELQSLADVFLGEKFAGFSKALFLADSSQQGCPIVCCNREFSALSGYPIEEAGGRDCFFMTEAAPLDLLDEEVSMAYHNFFSVAMRGELYEGQQLDGASERTLMSGELACTLTVARKSGEFLHVIAYLKQVELDDQNVVVGLLAEIAEETRTERGPCQTPSGLSKASDGFADFAWARDMSAASGAQSRLAPSGLEGGMVQLEGLLGEDFWYSAPMRRQTAV